jgi:hypothetical protein
MIPRRVLRGGIIIELPWHTAAHSGISKEGFRQQFAQFAPLMEAGGFDFQPPKESMFFQMKFFLVFIPCL